VLSFACVSVHISTPSVIRFSTFVVSAAIEAMGRLFECVGRMVRRVNFNNYFQLECVGL
jgi:hypothetical protein